MSDRWAWVGLGFILAATFLVNRDALRSSFFADDYLFLDVVRGRSLWAALSGPDAIGNFYRPLSRQFYFWLLAALSHESPGVFHLMAFLLFALTIVGLFHLGRSLAGSYGGLAAAAFYGLHYAQDVALRWASCSQDLLAVGFAVWAMVFHQRGARWLGAGLYLGGVLSKETVALLPLVVLAYERWVAQRPWRQALLETLPYGVALVLWGGLLGWAATGRVHYGATLKVGWEGPSAATLHGFRVILGLENPRLWGTTLGTVPIPLIAWAFVAAALMLAVPNRAPGSRALLWPVSWFVAGLVPTLPVGHVWSAYFYLFALAGVSLLVAGVLAGRGKLAASSVILLVAAMGQMSRYMPEFGSPGAWSSSSHVNRHYIRRATDLIESLMGDLKQLHPGKFQPHSTLFFASMPVYGGFQAGGGPLVRWLYRDPTLSGYYLSQFSRSRVGKGELHYYVYRRGRLEEDYKGIDHFMGPAAALMMGDNLEGARDAWSLGLERGYRQGDPYYWMAWIDWALGDSTKAKGSLATHGFRLSRETPASLQHAMNPTTHGDSSDAVLVLYQGVRSDVLCPTVHHRLADLAGRMRDYVGLGDLESWVCSVLDPGNPQSWRRLGLRHLEGHRFRLAAQALRRYKDMVGEAAQNDRVATKALEVAEGFLPGGRLERQSVAGYTPSRPESP